MLLIRCNTFNHEEIGKNLQRISKIKHIIKKCNWKGIDYPSGRNHQKKFEKNNSKIAVNVFYVEKCIPPIFQITTQIMKIKSFF